MDPDSDDDMELGDDNEDGDDYGDGYEAQLGHLIVAVLHDDSLDLKAKRKKILKALQLLDEPADEDSDESDDEADDEPLESDDAEDAENGEEQDSGEMTDDETDTGESTRAFVDHHDPAVRRLAERFDRLRAKQRLRSRRAKIRRLCERANLPPSLLSSLFLEQLTRAPDEKSIRALIEDRRRLAGIRLPRSAAPGSGTRMDVKEFAKQLRKEI
jgi:hypothetical protein